MVRLFRTYKHSNVVDPYLQMTLKTKNNLCSFFVDECRNNLNFDSINDITRRKIFFLAEDQNSKWEKQKLHLTNEHSYNAEKKCKTLTLLIKWEKIQAPKLCIEN